MRHPSDERLLACSVAAKAGGREPAALQSARKHLAEGCPRCLVRAAQYRELVELLSIAPPLDPPPEWIAKAAARIRGEIAASTRPERTRSAGGRAVSRMRGAWQRLEAHLVLDSLLAPAPAGIRGATSLRQLLYLSPLGRLHLQVTQVGPRRVEILGQFVPGTEPAEEGLSGEVILDAEGARRRKPLSPAGEFRFPSVPIAEVRLEVRTAGRVMVVESLRL